MLWKKINTIKYKGISDCLKDFKKKYVLSYWILDITKKIKNHKFDKNKKYEIHRIKVKSLGFKNQLN